MTVDWKKKLIPKVLISDSDYLKRELACGATLKVIRKRIDSSDAILFVDSEFSRSLQWFVYELQYQYVEQKIKLIIYLSVHNASKHTDNIGTFHDL